MQQCRPDGGVVVRGDAFGDARVDQRSRGVERAVASLGGVETLVDAHAEIARVVGADDTAEALGSGDVPVLATPRVVAWLEGATVAALRGRLKPGETSVGVRVEIDHRAPSAVGELIRADARVVRHAGRAIDFVVRARSAAGDVIAEGTVGRVIVDRAQFVSRL
jgi:fluoroacetyl-CoA thioesterase